MKDNKLLYKKLLIFLIFIFFAILFSFMIVDGYLELRRDLKIQSAATNDIIDQRVGSLLTEINIFPQYVGKDLLFLGNLSSLRKVLNFDGEELEEGVIRDLEEDFLGFIKQSTAYYQLMYVDENGYEIVKTEFDGRSYNILVKDELQNVKDGLYFNKTIGLEAEEAFISRLDLNIKDGVVENRGTEVNPSYVPVIKTAVPVFDNEEELRGIVVLNVYADYFLDDIRQFQRNDEKIFLIDKEGDYLAFPDKSKEFASVLGGFDNFYADYPEVSKEVLFDSSKRRFETDDSIFSFRYIYPTAGDSVIHKGSQKVFGDNPEEQYFWVLISINKKNAINSTVASLKKEYLYFLLFSGTIVFIILVLIFVLEFEIYIRKGDRRRK